MLVECVDTHVIVGWIPLLRPSSVLPSFVSLPSLSISLPVLVRFIFVSLSFSARFPPVFPPSPLRFSSVSLPGPCVFKNVDLGDFVIPSFNFDRRSFTALHRGFERLSCVNMH